MAAGPLGVGAARGGGRVWRGGPQALTQPVPPAPVHPGDAARRQSSGKRAKARVSASRIVIGAHQVQTPCQAIWEAAVSAVAAIAAGISRDQVRAAAMSATAMAGHR